VIKKNKKKNKKKHNWPFKERGGAAQYIPPCLPVSVEIMATLMLRVSRHFTRP